MTLKGYRTIIFNLLMGLATIVGLQVAPDTLQHWATIGAIVWMSGGILLRSITTTPVFTTLLPPEVRTVATELAALIPAGEAPLADAGGGSPVAGPATGGAVTGPPADLVALATSISQALATVQTVHAQVASALQAGKGAVTAALPAVTPPTPKEPQKDVQAQEPKGPAPAATTAGPAAATAMALLVCLGLAGLPLLGGCAPAIQAGAPAEATVKASIAGCTGYATALGALAAFRRAGKLSAPQIARVDDLRPTLNAICEGPYPADPGAAETQVKQGVGLLQAIIAEVK